MKTRRCAAPAVKGLIRVTRDGECNVYTGHTCRQVEISSGGENKLIESRFGHDHDISCYVKVTYHPLYSMNKFVTNKSKSP